MSNFLAIATVTATLSQTILAAIVRDVDGSTVAMVRPDSAAGDTPTTGVNLYLYQVTPNAAWRNADLPTRRPNGELVQRPQAALDLHYLLSFYGKHVELEPQRLLGSVVCALSARPVLTRQMIQDTLANSTFNFLGKSNLHEAIELVKFTPLPLSLEELSKLWSVFFQTPYTLSVAYQGTVVLIESEDTPQAALPVRERELYVVPFRQPIIEQVKSQAGADQPIVVDSTLVISGKRLRGDLTKLRVDGFERTPAPQDVSDTQILLPLGRPFGSPPQPAILLPAGVHGAQVIHQALMGSPPVPHLGVESNLAAFVLHPQLEIRGKNLQDMGNNLYSGTIDVTIKPAVGDTQRVVLLLNEIPLAPASPPATADSILAAYTFDASPIAQLSPPMSPPGPTENLSIPISRVKAGKYLARIKVDGAESPLKLDPNGRYNEPQVSIP